MANMSYCRFRNTLNALNDCVDTIENATKKDGKIINDGEEISHEEKVAMFNMKIQCENYLTYIEQFEDCI